MGATGTPGSLAALHRAAAEARVRDAELWVVLAWQSPGGELGSRNGLGTIALAECRAAAVERLREVLDTAFGVLKPGVTLSGFAVRGTPGAALVGTARDPEDLLVWVRAPAARCAASYAPRWPATAWRTPPVPSWWSPRPRSSPTWRPYTAATPGGSAWTRES